ncbi:Conserved_hypothetical protein [Hexamita inflata]|uniref:Uncharacterized protein n=1 Tax=Hexamita inflata TaxID=28002 RepID=A0AA86NQN4_9EUKA|nr:Conserved hypothetical protein [Hexamita inflata]CAI9938961.1 Conserved hypothetical protein [Hexamita inflata]CAI9976201.1 Conserved hypothetical protein [Hexamita inflata]
MTKREKEPYNAVNDAAIIRGAIQQEKIAMHGQGKQVFTQVQTDQQNWRPQKKMFPGIDCYALPTYPRKPRTVQK